MTGKGVRLNEKWKELMRIEKTKLIHILKCLSKLLLIDKNPLCNMINYLNVTALGFHQTWNRSVEIDQKCLEKVNGHSVQCILEKLLSVYGWSARPSTLTRNALRKLVTRLCSEALVCVQPDLLQCMHDQREIFNDKLKWHAWLFYQVLK